MRTPTDHGYAILVDENDDTMSVIVCADVIGGVPHNAYAVHAHQSSVEVDDRIKLVNSNNGRHTNEVVEVSGDSWGTVHVRALRESKGFSATLQELTAGP